MEKCAGAHMRSWKGAHSSVFPLGIERREGGVRFFQANAHLLDGEIVFFGEGKERFSVQDAIHQKLPLQRLHFFEHVYDLQLFRQFVLGDRGGNGGEKIVAGKKLVFLLRRQSMDLLMVTAFNQPFMFLSDLKE